MSSDKDFKQWEKESYEDFKYIDDLIKIGHTRHCACRQVWGDGECECNRNKNMKPEERINRIKKLIEILRRS